MLAALLKKNFPHPFFCRNFQSNSVFEPLSMTVFDRLHKIASLSKARKACKNQKKAFTCALQNGCSEKILKAQNTYLGVFPQ